MFASLSLLYPAMLVGSLVALAGLVYAYLRHGRGESVTVASLIILRALAKKASSPKKFTPPLRIIAEAILLLFLLLAAAGPYSPEEGSAIAVILDNSLSMKGRVTTEARGGDLFAQAQREVERIMNKYPTSTQVSLYVTSPTLTLVGGRARSPSEIVTLSAQVEVVYGVDALSRAVTQVAQNPNYARTIVITDRKLMLSPETATFVEMHTLTDPAHLPQNIAITGFDEGPQQSNERQFFLGMFSTNDQPTKVKVQVKGRAARGEEVELVSFVNTLPVQESVRVPVVIPSVRIQERAVNSLHVVVTLEEMVGGAKGFADALSEDNEAYLVIGGKEGVVHLVSDLSVRALGLDAVKQYRVESVTREKVTDLTTGSLILHRWAPQEKLPEVSSLFLLPPKSLSYLSSTKNMVRGEITRFSAAHPLLRYLSLSSLSLREFSPLSPPPWMEVLISSTEGPIALYGIQNKKRYVALGFDIFPYEGKRSPTLSIFLLNILSWLAAENVELAPYGSLTDAQDVPEYVDGAREKLALSSDTARSYAPLRPGILMYTRTNRVEPEVRAVNFYDESESRYGNAEELEVVRIKDTVKVGEKRASMQHVLVRVGIIALTLYLLAMSFFARLRRTT